MINSSNSLMSDDVSIECRVRRSPHAANAQFGETEYMSCTMRSWKNADRSSSDIVNTVMSDGPELLLQPVSESPNASNGTFSERFQSFGSASKSKRRVYDMVEHEPKKATPLSIPVFDIVVVDTHSSSISSSSSTKKCHVLYITTISHGYLEFSFSQQNAHDVLVAFLSASLPRERIVVQQDNMSVCGDNLSTTSKLIQEGCSFDLDAFEADRIQQRVQSETFSERMQRKISRFAMVFEEMSSAISDCCVGCDGSAAATTTSPPADYKSDYDDAKRDSPPRSQGHLEFSDSAMEFSQSSSVSIASHQQDDTTRASGKQVNSHLSRRMSWEPEMQSAM